MYCLRLTTITLTLLAVILTPLAASAKPDPQCIRSCGNQLRSCQASCNSAVNSCKRDCSRNCSAEGMTNLVCLNACLLNCEADSSCTEGCLAENKSCTASCPEVQ